MFEKFKKIVIKLDDFREEKLEDFIIANILIKVDENSTVDTLEQQAIETALTAGNAYLATYGMPTIPENVRKQIAEYTVKGLGKANKLLQKQVKKKNKWYNRRHNDTV